VCGRLGGRWAYPPGASSVRLAAESHRYGAFEHIEKALPMRRPERAPGLELRGVLGKGRSQCRRCVHDNGDRIKARQGHGHKSIWRLQQMRELAIAAGMSQVMHEVFSVP
jgi:hypothetical protein